MSKLLLHIGHPKTGTTALQTVLYANAGMLLESGVWYPTAPPPASRKHELAMPFLTGRINDALRRRTVAADNVIAALSEEYWTSLLHDAHRVSRETTILSAEEFWTALEPDRQNFFAQLSKLGDDIVVAGYVRSPAKRFLSQINQNIRMFRGIVKRPAEYYRPVIRSYRQSGFRHIELNVFDPARLVGNDLVTDFMHRFLPNVAIDLTRGDVERRNESVSNEALVLLEEIQTRWCGTPRNGIDPRRARAVALVREADRTVGAGSTRPTLLPKIEQSLVAHAVDLNWLRNDCGIEFDDVDYALVGSGKHKDLSSLHRVADFCPVDRDRLAALNATIKEPLERLFKEKPLRRALSYIRL